MESLNSTHFYIIESLKQGEEKTGEALFNDIIRRRLDMYGKAEDCELFQVDSKQALLLAFEKIRSDTIHKLADPVLHFEMHGSDRGLELSNGEFISWQELQRQLIEINGISQCNLFITMASCSGGYIFRAIDPSSRSPFWGFIGSTVIVTAEEILVNYTAFYDAYLSTGNLLNGLEALNKSNESGVSKFQFFNTEHAFNLAYDKYEKDWLTPEMVDKRLASGLIEARRYDKMSNYTDEEIKKQLKTIIVDQKDVLKDRMMTKFFMWDLFPDRRPK